MAGKHAAPRHAVPRSTGRTTRPPEEPLRPVPYTDPDDVPPRAPRTQAASPRPVQRRPVRKPKSRWKTVVAWILCFFMLFAGIVYFPSFASVFMLLFAVLILPVEPVRRFFAQIGLRNTAKTVVLVVLFVLGVMLAPLSSRARNSISLTDGSASPTPNTSASASPTLEPTVEPTSSPTPTEKPTAEPTVRPTATPAANPTAEPTMEPTAAPTAEPTAEPTEVPAEEIGEDYTGESGEDDTGEYGGESGGEYGGDSDTSDYDPSYGTVTPDEPTSDPTYDTPSTDDSIIVYVTDTGTKYHRAGCSYLSDSSIEITLDTAKRNYEPCSKCNPPT